MRLTECMSFKPKMLTEAIRFNSEAMAILRENSDIMRVGIEFEFHVDNADEMMGGDTDEDLLNNPEVFDALIDRIESELNDEFVDDLAMFMNEADLFPTTEEEFRDMLDDSSDLAEYIEWINDTITQRQIKAIVEAGLPSFMNDLYNFINFMPSNVQGPEDIEAWIDSEGFQDNIDGYESFMEEHGDEQTANNYKMYFHDQIRMDDDFFMDMRQQYEDEVMDQFRNDVFSASETFGLVMYIDDLLQQTDFYHMIEKVEEDVSVPRGVEVVTLPLTLTNANECMSKMNAFIRQHGSTSEKTGLHANLSMTPPSRMEQVDPLRVITLGDSDFFQNSTGTTKALNNIKDKYAQRNIFVKQNTDLFNGRSLPAIAQAYLDGNLEGMEEAVRFYLVDGPSAQDRYVAFNFQPLIKEYDRAKKRVEFRFFGQSGGGTGYETRTDEMLADINFLCYVLIMSTGGRGRYAEEAHRKSLVRMLNRATKLKMGMTFDELVNTIRRQE